MSDDKKDPWASGEAAVERRNPYVKFEKIGDKCRGYLVAKSTRPSTFPGKEDTDQRVYTLCVKEGEMYQAYSNKEKIEVKGGEYIDIYGNAPAQRSEGDRKLNIIYGFDNLILGMMIGAKFTEELPPKTKGFKPAKIIKGIKWESDVSQEAVDTYVGHAPTLTGAGAEAPAKAAATPDGEPF